MKKDFSQNFVESEKTKLYLIVRSSNKYMLLHSTREHEEDFFSTLSLEIEATNQESLQIAKFLHDRDLAIESVRTLLEEKSFEYSFSDDVPGVTSIVKVVPVNVAPADAMLIRDEEERLFLDKEDFCQKLTESPYGNKWLIEAIRSL